jgi:hypothetical protein
MNHRWNYLVALVLLTLLAFGCATSGVNPDRPDASAGYVDFYTDANMGFAWDVREAALTGGDFELVFSDLEPVGGNILRLPFTPGRHRLRITLLNRVVTKPANIDITVESGRVTPVRIVLAEAGSTVVVSKKTIMGGTGSRSGRQTDTRRDESTMYALSTTADSPVSIQPVQQMPYAR